MATKCDKLMQVGICFSKTNIYFLFCILFICHMSCDLRLIELSAITTAKGCISNRCSKNSSIYNLVKHPIMLQSASLVCEKQRPTWTYKSTALPARITAFTVHTCLPNTYMLGCFFFFVFVVGVTKILFM